MVGAESVASCLTPAVPVFSTLLAHQCACMRGGQRRGAGEGGRGRHFIMARWKAIGDDSGRKGRGGDEGGRLGRVVSCRLTTETTVC